MERLMESWKRARAQGQVGALSEEEEERLPALGSLGGREEWQGRSSECWMRRKSWGRQPRRDERPALERQLAVWGEEEEEREAVREGEREWAREWGREEEQRGW